MRFVFLKIEIEQVTSLEIFQSRRTTFVMVNLMILCVNKEQSFSGSSTSRAIFPRGSQDSQRRSPSVVASHDFAQLTYLVNSY